MEIDYHWRRPGYRCAPLTHLFSVNFTGARALRRQVPRRKPRQTPMRIPMWMPRLMLRLSLRLLGFRLGLGNLVVLLGLLAFRIRNIPWPNPKREVATNAASNGKLCWHWLC